MSQSSINSARLREDEVEVLPPAHFEEPEPPDGYDDYFEEISCIIENIFHDLEDETGDGGVSVVVGEDEAYDRLNDIENLLRQVEDAIHTASEIESCNELEEAKYMAENLQHGLDSAKQEADKQISKAVQDFGIWWAHKQAREMEKEDAGRIIRSLATKLDKRRREYTYLLKIYNEVHAMYKSEQQKRKELKAQLDTMGL